MSPVMVHTGVDKYLPCIAEVTLNACQNIQVTRRKQMGGDGPSLILRLTSAKDGVAYRGELSSWRWLRWTERLGHDNSPIKKA